MATRMKTIEYAMNTKATLTDNTLQAMTQRTIYIPEFSGTVTFKKAIVMVSVKEGATMTTGNYTSRRIDLSVNSATATSVTNANLITGSGENETLFFSGDFTSHFTTNWTTGTSKTLDISVLVDYTATTIVAVDVDATLYITYEYDDTQPTQIKTVYIPLDAPVTTLATTKPGTAVATIPALNTELPETFKTYRDMFIVAQGNINQTASATDSNVEMQIETYTQFTSSTLEMGAASDYWDRYVWNINTINAGGFIDTSVTRGFYIWGSVARFNHPQVYMVVTYEFDATGTTGCFNSVLLNASYGAMMGGTAATEYQRQETSLWIEEPGTITTKQIAYYATWEQAAAIGGLNARIGIGSFITYTDGAAAMQGSNGLMIRNDSAFTLARGKNTINADFYRTDTADFGLALTGFFIVNYTSDKPTNGYGAGLHTVKWNLKVFGTVATATNSVVAATSINIPETSYFLNSMGGQILHFPNTTGVYNGLVFLMEKTNGGGSWLPALVTNGHTDAEQGLHTDNFKIDNCAIYRWAGDSINSRLDPEATRRWWVAYSAAATGFFHIDVWLTYHTNTFTFAGNITGSNGGTVNVSVYSPTEGKIAQTSRAGNGAYTTTVYDNTESLFADAYEDGTYKGRSGNATAS